MKNLLFIILFAQSALAQTPALMDAMKASGKQWLSIESENKQRLADLKSDVAAVRRAAAADSTVAEMRAGFAAMLRLMKQLNAEIDKP